MSPADFETMGLVETALLSCTTNTHANFVRAMLGILP